MLNSVSRSLSEVGRSPSHVGALRRRPLSVPAITRTLESSGTEAREERIQHGETEEQRTNGSAPIGLAGAAKRRRGPRRTRHEPHRPIDRLASRPSRPVLVGLLCRPIRQTRCARSRLHPPFVSPLLRFSVLDRWLRPLRYPTSISLNRCSQSASSRPTPPASGSDFANQRAASCCAVSSR